jgi:hypothetical protein
MSSMTRLLVNEKRKTFPANPVTANTPLLESRRMSRRIRNMLPEVDRSSSSVAAAVNMQPFMVRYTSSMYALTGPGDRALRDGRSRPSLCGKLSFEQPIPESLIVMRLTGALLSCSVPPRDNPKTKT